VEVARNASISREEPRDYQEMWARGREGRAIPIARDVWGRGNTYGGKHECLSRTGSETNGLAVTDESRGRK